VLYFPVPFFAWLVVPPTSLTGTSDPRSSHVRTTSTFTWTIQLSIEIGNLMPTFEIETQ